MAVSEPNHVGPAAPTRSGLHARTAGVFTMTPSPDEFPHDDPGGHAAGIGFLQLFMEATARVERTDSHDVIEGASPDTGAADDRRLR
jgi:hypothetical protein